MPLVLRQVVITGRNRCMLTKLDPLEPGRKLLEQMMKDAQRAGSDVPMDDKLKILDRWIKFQTLVQRAKDGAMGRGFDADPEDEAGEI
jgi:hypothetical protein